MNTAGGSTQAGRNKFLDRLEYVGNKLPDPAVIFLIALAITWVASVVLAPVQFTEIDPRSSKPIQVVNMLTGQSFASFLAKMVKTFTDFPPLGVVLVAMLGVGVAEHTGFITTGLKYLLRITPRMLLTPMLVLVAIISHSAADTGYVLVIPLGGILFAAAGRHPVAGIAAAFAGVSGGFSETFLPSSLDPLLQGFTQAAAKIIDPARNVNPLCNWYFMSASSLLIVSAAWFLTDRVIEPRLRALPVDGDGKSDQTLDAMSARERNGFLAGLGTMGVLGLLLAWVAAPADSPWRAPDGALTSHGSPLMESIVPLIALFFFFPGIVHGYIAGTVKTHRDVIQGMGKSMSGLGYYLVMAFFAAQFTFVFRESNIGALIALKGGNMLKALSMPGAVTVIGIILLTTTINLLIGSASAKWALLAPIFVPMLMQVNLSPELTQAAFRVGDSSTNIITPLLPYFPLIVVYCQKHSKGTGIGTLMSTMLPYSISFLILWTTMLMIWWGLNLPLGLQSSYTP